MKIPQNDIDLFFRLHPTLLQYVNQRLQLLPKITTAEELRLSGVENVALVRKELWKNLEFINEFIIANPSGLSEEEIAIVATWKFALRGKFYIFRHLKKYSLFLTEKNPTKVYGVYSLNTPLEEMFWRVPVYAEAVLIPFRDCIIYDGILYPYAIRFGPGFHFDLNETYCESKKRFGIVEKLEFT